MARRWWSHFTRSWRLYPGLQFTTVLVLSSTMTIFVLLLGIASNLSSVLATMGDQVRVSLYLSDSEDLQATQGRVQDFLKQFPAVTKSEYVSKDLALQQFKKEMTDWSWELIEEEGNPLPASFEVTLDPTLQKAQLLRFLEVFKSKAADMEDIDEVSYGQSWLMGYSSLVRAFSQANWFFLCTLLFASLLVVGNTIRHSISQRREEIEILELVGASRSMIQWPFVFEGVMTGLIASAFAAVLSLLVTQVFQSAFSESLGFLGVGTIVPAVTPGNLVALVLGGALIGGFGAYVCIRRMAGGWVATQRIYSLQDYK